MRALPADLASRLEGMVAAFVNTHAAPGAAVGVVLGDEPAWHLGYGFTDLDTQVEPDQRTLFRVASITKTFTGTAVVQLRDEGKLRLDDPLVAFVPELKAGRNPFGPIEDVTLRRLLTHQSGLMGEPPTQDLAEHVFPAVEEVLERADLIEVVIPPDAQDKYSNLTYQLLGEVVERVSGRPYREYVDAEILRPLGMADSTFDPSPGQEPRVAKGYDPRIFLEEPPVSIGREKLTDADGGLWSTVIDLARWVAFQFREDGGERGGAQVLRGESLREMHRAGVITDAGWTEAQGLSWYSTRRGERVFVGHAGGTAGFSSRIAFSVPERMGVIVLLNGSAPASALALDLAVAVSEALAAVPPTEPAVRPAPIREEWRELPGLYWWGEYGSELRIEWRAGRLTLLWQEKVPDREPKPTLEPTDDPLVFIVRGGRETGERAVFHRGSAGSIVRVVVAGYPFARLVEAQ